MPTLPTLYSKNSDGSVNFWTIRVIPENGYGIISTNYGRVNGEIQETNDVVSEGKNIGKANETTPLEQAQKEAKSRWTKKKKSGYVESIADAKADKVDAIIEGGVEPMLAHKYRDHAAKVVWPAYAQPKLDGIRCIAILKNGKCTLWSRTRKPITGVPHIIATMERMFPQRNQIFDGELYNHEMKKDFEKIVSYVRQSKPQPGHEIVQYHIYDTITPENFAERSRKLSNELPGLGSSPVQHVPTHKMATEADMMDYFSICREAGYEGCMVRNANSKYENKRSYNLQKVKEFDDAEFVIAGTMEGRGKMAGKAIFGCKVNPKLATAYKANGEFDTDHPNQFGAKMEGAIDSLAQYLNNPDVVGKKLTVRYQGFTNGNKPRFPVGVAIRDYE